MYQKRPSSEPVAVQMRAIIAGNIRVQQVITTNTQPIILISSNPRQDPDCIATGMKHVAGFIIIVGLFVTKQSHVSIHKCIQLNWVSMEPSGAAMKGLSAETSDNLHVVRDTPLGTVREIIKRTVRHSLDVPEIVAVSSFSPFLHQSIGRLRSCHCAGE